MHNYIRTVFFLPKEVNGPTVYGKEQFRGMSCKVLWEKSSGHGRGGRVIGISLKDQRTE